MIDCQAAITSAGGRTTLQAAGRGWPACVAPTRRNSKSYGSAAAGPLMAGALPFVAVFVCVSECVCLCVRACGRAPQPPPAVLPCPHTHTHARTHARTPDWHILLTDTRIAGFGDHVGYQLLTRLSMPRLTLCTRRPKGEHSKRQNKRRAARSAGLEQLRVTAAREAESGLLQGLYLPLSGHRCCRCVPFSACVCGHVFFFANICATRIRTCQCKHVHTHIHMHIYTHTCTHTHTPAGAS